jgi:hypothetical protein
MLRHLARRIFGSPSRRLPPLSEIPPVMRPTPSDGTQPKQVFRTVGLTEQRLRAANKRSWITSTNGWSDILGRFSSKSKD